MSAKNLKPLKAGAKIVCTIAFSLFLSGCLAGKPKISITNKNSSGILPASSTKYGFSVAGGVASNATYKVTYSVNYSGGSGSDATNTVRSADPEVLHHVH